MNELSIDEISGESIKKGLINAVKKRLNSDDVELCIEHGSKKGDNFIGEIYRILFKDANDENNEKQSSLILKIAPKNLFRRERFRIRDLFLREINMYDEVLPFFDEFQLSKGVDPMRNGFNECARCYFSISEEMSESLFLEDLKKKEFEMIDHRTEPLSFDHMTLLLKALGKFHALSFAIKDQQPEKFNQLTSLIPEQYWTMLDSEFKIHYPLLVKRLLDVLEEEKRFDLLEKFKKAAGDDYSTTIFRLVSSTAADPYAVICHGDLTIFNTMYRKNEQGKPIGIQFFDWQFTRYASPITDLVLYLFCSTTEEIRDQHYEDFLKIYHESISDLLIKLGSDPQKLFPYEALLDQLRNFGLYTIFVGAMLVPMLCAEVASMPNFDDIAEKVSKGEDNVVDDDFFQVSDESKFAYNKKVTDIFDDMVRIGCI